MCSVTAVAELTSVEDALDLVLARVRPLPAEPVALADAAGRVLAEDAVAAIDLPRFASSAMDGFAVRSADTPGRLPVVARVAAGRPAGRALAPGEAMAISTGGVVPEGADAVVPIELVRDEGERVDVPQAAPEGANVRPRGGDVGAGDVVVAAGVPLTPSRLAALASSGVVTQHSFPVEPQLRPNDQVGVITVRYFGGDALQRFAAAIDEMVKQKAQAIVIDVRGNEGMRDPKSPVAVSLAMLSRLLPAGSGKVVVGYAVSRDRNRLDVLIAVTSQWTRHLPRFSTRFSTVSTFSTSSIATA